MDRPEPGTLPPRIERPGPGDAPALASLAARSFRAAYGSILPEPDLADYERAVFGETRVRAEIDDPRIRLRIARCGDALCGYSRLEATAPPAAVEGTRSIELVRLYVESTWQGRGIGRALLQDALSHAQAYEACWLRVWVGNARAIELYRRYGFGVVGEGPYVVGSTRETVLLMVRGAGPP